MSNPIKLSIFNSDIGTCIPDLYTNWVLIIVIGYGITGQKGEPGEKGNNYNYVSINWPSQHATHGLHYHLMCMSRVYA